jgi:uncharacterized membrane protein
MSNPKKRKGQPEAKTARPERPPVPDAIEPEPPVSLPVLTPEIVEEVSKRGGIEVEEARRILGVAEEVFEETVEHHQGPMPHPRLLAEYEKAHPGLALEMWGAVKGEMAHRHAMESRALEAEILDRQEERRAERRGADYALYIVLFAISAAAGCAAIGGTAAGVIGAVVGGGSLLSLVTAFIQGRRLARREASSEAKGD